MHPAIKQHNYHQWANNRVFTHLKKLPEKVYNNQVTSGFSSIAELIVHIYQTDGMWLSVMSGDAMQETFKKIGVLKEKSEDKSLLEMEALYKEVAGEYQTFLKNHNNLDAPMTIEHPKYGKQDVSVNEMINHVVNHGTYHRGNITTMLRQQGHPGASTDYIFYLYNLP